MGTPDQNEWELYAVANPGQRMRAPVECTSMPWIYHFTHLDQAYSSLREGKLCSRLVHDKSRLNKRRISVCWLSPNDWTGKGGFRYGNVGFRFDINTIVKNRICYWIEAAEYEIRAPRILLSMKDYDGTFERYDPSRDDGPWKYYPDNNSHFFNGTICLELLIEDDIDLSICDGVEIKDHSSQYCSIHRTNPQDCAELSMPRTLAGSLFLSRVVSTNWDVQKLKWTTKNGGRVVPGPHSRRRSTTCQYECRTSRHSMVRSHRSMKMGYALSMQLYGHSRMDDVMRFRSCLDCLRVSWNA